MDKKGYRSVALAVSMALASSAVSAELLISQYVEGSSNNKAIEIANPDSEAVSLEGYSVKLFSNGSESAGSSYSFGDGTLAGQDVFVISHSSAALAGITDVSDETSSIANFNGNDAVALYKTVDGEEVLIDIIGTIGDSSTFAKDITLVRSATEPSATYIESEWTELGKDDTTGLGEYGAGPVVETPVFDCTVDGLEPEFTAISAIQGDGSSTSMYGDEVYVKGVVSAVTTSLAKGYYLQSLEADDDEKTSEGLFVYTGESSSDLIPGNVVCLQGKVSEYWGQTQLIEYDDKVAVVGNQEAPAANEMAIIDSDDSMQDTYERYEGMLVKLTPELDMRVTRTFSFDYSSYRNNMVLAQGRPNPQPNQLYFAGSDEAIAQTEENEQKRLFIESDEKAANGEVPYYADFGMTDEDGDGSTKDYIRINDRVEGMEGVMSYSYGEYRLIVTNTVSDENFVHLTPRKEEPDVYEGHLRIATFNVLNYFNSPFGGDENQFGDNRGAYSEEEFALQEAKIVEAIVNLDADIIGLMEIENNGFGENSAIQRLLNAVNSKMANKKQRYEFVAVDSNEDGQTDASDSVGTDAIAVGVLYRPKVVKLQTSRVIKMPSQNAPEVTEDGSVIEDGQNYQRDAIAPTFKVKGVPGYKNNNLITVAVNHFKSKGSTCWEDAAAIEDGGQGGDDADKQGSCENFRVAAAVALGDAMEDIKGHKVILGDLNSYAMEDPILVLTEFDREELGRDITAARNTYIDGEEQFGDNGAVIDESYGYVNVMNLFHDDAWSYSYNDEVGSLDHILISDTLAFSVVDANEWHINAAESSLFSYSGKYTGDLPKYEDQYRSSDHDPAVMELDLRGGSLGATMLLVLGGLGFVRSRKRVD